MALALTVTPSPPHLFIAEWNNFVSYNEYCIRACIGPNAKKFCPHVYE